MDAMNYGIVSCVSLADHLKHLPTGQVTEIIEMFNACLHDSLPSVTADNDISDGGL